MQWLKDVALDTYHTYMTCDTHLPFATPLAVGSVKSIREMVGMLPSFLGMQQNYTAMRTFGITSCPPCRHLGSLASSMTSSSPGLPGMGPTTQDPASTPGKDTRCEACAWLRKCLGLCHQNGA